ncbi:MAG UNVERIFIED_CONTAM: transglycosylase domain-containing protein [Anaerolineae bacterium]
MVAEINRLYTPEQILEWHLNTNYYGNNAYGIAAAALVYFNKRVATLTTDEIAMLVAIPLAPQYNPIENEESGAWATSQCATGLTTSWHSHGRLQHL